MNQASGYSLTDYGDMIADSVRATAYEQALKHVVRPGSVVVDIGTGPAFFGLLAVQLGAQAVYAVEPDNSILVGKMIAKDSGLEDRIQFFQGVSQNFTLPGDLRADVIVSDLRGCSPFYGLHIPSLVDARERLLKPDGVILAQRDIVHCAPVSAPEAYRTVCDPWSLELWGLNLRRAHSLVSNRHFGLIGQAELLAPPSPWVTLDYRTIQSPNHCGTMTWSVEENSTMHGWAIWFDAQVHEEIGFTNRPGRLGSIYGQMFLPIPQPIDLGSGDQLTLRLRANLVGTSYVWSWDTSFIGVDGKSHRFQQSDFKGHLFETSDWVKRQSTHRCKLSSDGHAAAFVLSQMAENLAVGEIAKNLAEKFPNFGVAPERASVFVADLSSQFSILRSD